MEAKMSILCKISLKIKGLSLKKMLETTNDFKVCISYGNFMIYYIHIFNSNLFFFNNLLLIRKVKCLKKNVLVNIYKFFSIKEVQMNKCFCNSSEDAGANTE